MPDDYTYEMRASHMPCPRCGRWHTAMNCADQYQHNYGTTWVPDGYWYCPRCGTTVQNGTYHTCTVYGYAQVYTTDRDLLQQILEILKEIKKVLEGLETK